MFPGRLHISSLSYDTNTDYDDYYDHHAEVQLKQQRQARKTVFYDEYGFWPNARQLNSFESGDYGNQNYGNDYDFDHDNGFNDWTEPEFDTVNPASGLPMVGGGWQGFDTGGSVYGVNNF